METNIGRQFEAWWFIHRIGSYKSTGNQLQTMVLTIYGQHEVFWTHVMSSVNICVGHIHMNNSLLTGSPKFCWSQSLIFAKSKTWYGPIPSCKFARILESLFGNCKYTIGLHFHISLPRNKGHVEVITHETRPCPSILDPLKTKPPKINISNTKPMFSSGCILNVKGIIIQHHSRSLNSTVNCFLNMEYIHLILHKLQIFM